MPNCPNCESKDVVKNGFIHNGNQNLNCKACGRQFVEAPQQKIISEKQIFGELTLLYSLNNFTRLLGKRLVIPIVLNGLTVRCGHVKLLRIPQTRLLSYNSKPLKPS